MTPVYNYKARDDDGIMKKSDLVAADLKEAIIILKEKGLYAITIKESTDQWGNGFFNRFFRRYANARELTVFSRQLAVMIRAGISITYSLEILSEQLENKRFKKALQSTVKSLEAGKSLQESLGNNGKIFPSIFINMIGAGEKAGALENVLERMAFYYETDYEMQKKIQGALIYPSILLISVIIVLFIMTAFVLPEFSAVFLGLNMKLPFLTQIILGLGEVFQWIIMIMFFIVVLVFLTLKLEVTFGENRSKFRKYIDLLKLRLPIMKNIVQKVILARFSRTLSTLISNGIPLLTSLELVKTTINNKVIEKTIQDAYNNIKDGESLCGPFYNKKHIPPLVSKMIAVGEESGSLDEMLVKVADYFELESKHTLDRFSSLIEPTLILFMAVVIGLIVVSFVLPMMQFWQVF